MSAAAARGKVYLVGAGPGDPGLMTARALELIASADVILHDRLIPAGALAGARNDAQLVYVGKAPGEEPVSQARIEELMVGHAREGRSVVRLKGGDPFVFGRGGEECEALAEAGVSFEVVPGVTAGVAAPAYAGIPVTHREDASAVAFVTGHEDPAKEGTAIDWEALARFPGTLVLYMGVRSLPGTTRELIAAGRDPREPAAVVERGTHPAQRTVTADLEGIAAAAAASGLRAPAVVVVGAVTARRERIAWLEARPLHGRTVVVTRARAQAGSLAGRLRTLGAEAVEAPTIRIVPAIHSREVRGAIAEIGSYDLLCLTSPNGVDLFFEALAEGGLDARALAGVRVAAIGPGTTAALRGHGVAPDVVPERALGESLLDALADTKLRGRRVMLARAASAREVLPEGIREMGATVDDVALYETVPESLDDERREVCLRADYVTFTSASTVASFMAAMDGKPPAGRLVSIGPVTSAAARQAGLEVHVEAERHDLDGLVEALLADAETR